ncbi:MAG TPA: hypothetical protein VIH71_04840 [Solirubrobacteraceae bacterium]
MNHRSGRRDHVRRGTTVALCAALTVTSCLAIAAQSGRAHAYAPSERAHAAHVLKASDTAHLHYVSASGALLFDEGRATGTLPGRMRVHLNLGTTFTGSFTIYASGGSIEGRGSAAPHGSGTYESFSGTLTVTGGTGRYVHARGRGRLYGTFDRENYALVIETTGSLTY